MAPRPAGWRAQRTNAGPRSPAAPPRAARGLPLGCGDARAGRAGDALAAPGDGSQTLRRSQRLRVEASVHCSMFYADVMCSVSLRCRRPLHAAAPMIQDCRAPGSKRGDAGVQCIYGKVAGVARSGHNTQAPTEEAFVPRGLPPRQGTACTTRQPGANSPHGAAAAALRQGGTRGRPLGPGRAGGVGTGDAGASHARPRRRTLSPPPRGAGLASGHGPVAPCRRASDAARAGGLHRNGEGGRQRRPHS